MPKLISKSEPKNKKKATTKQRIVPKNQQWEKLKW